MPATTRWTRKKGGRKRLAKGASLDDDPEISFKKSAAAKRPRVDDDCPGGGGAGRSDEEVGQAKPPRRSPNGYILADPLPEGLMLTDLTKRRWKLVRSIGVGGFGEIYSAVSLDEDGAAVDGRGSGGGSGRRRSCRGMNLQQPAASHQAADYVVKVEPHSNGPLFVEINFYLRAARRSGVEEHKQRKGKSHLGVPHIEGSGSFHYGGKRLRFLVIPRYGTDLQTLLDNSGSALTLETASSVATQVVDSYEYIHSKGYVHKDVKGSNLLFALHPHGSPVRTGPQMQSPPSTAGFPAQEASGEPGAPSSRSGRLSRRNMPKTGSTASLPSTVTEDGQKRVYLVDYGLVSRYMQCGVHRPYVSDERSAHEGTLEYTSRDVHLGCVSRRGDVEVLFYNLVDWLGGKLPWDLQDTTVQQNQHQLHPKEIHQLKIDAFQDVDGFLSTAFENRPYPEFLRQMMLYVEKMAFEEKPDYCRLRSMLKQRSWHRPLGWKDSSSGYFSTTNSYPKASEPKKRQEVEPSSDEVTLSLAIVRGNGKAKRRAINPAAFEGCDPPGHHNLLSEGRGGEDEEVILRKQEELPKPRVIGTRQRDPPESASQRARKAELDRSRLLADYEVTRRSEERYLSERETLIRVECERSLRNPTPLMLRQLDKMRLRRRAGVPGEASLGAAGQQMVPSGSQLSDDLPGSRGTWDHDPINSSAESSNTPASSGQIMQRFRRRQTPRKRRRRSSSSHHHHPTSGCPSGGSGVSSANRSTSRLIAAKSPRIAGIGGRGGCGNISDISGIRKKGSLSKIRLPSLRGVRKRHPAGKAILGKQRIVGGTKLDLIKQHYLNNCAKARGCVGGGTDVTARSSKSPGPSTMPPATSSSSSSPPLPPFQAEPFQSTSPFRRSKRVVPLHVEKRSSFRQHVSNFIANVTRNIFKYSRS